MGELRFNPCHDAARSHDFFGHIFSQGGWMDPLGELMVRERSLILHTRNTRESKAEQGSSRAAQAPPCLIAKTNLAVVAQSVVRRDSLVFFPFPLLLHSTARALRASTLPHSLLALDENETRRTKSVTSKSLSKVQLEWRFSLEGRAFKSARGLSNERRYRAALSLKH